MINVNLTYNTNLKKKMKNEKINKLRLAPGKAAKGRPKLLVVDW